MHTHLLQDIGLCIVAATALAFIARLVRQPLILAYVLAGVAIGPGGFGWIDDRESVQILAELGLTFLMFIVGLEIDIKKLLAAGKPAAIVTAAQVIGSMLIGWTVASLLGFHGRDAVYLGAAIAFSSTMIVVKLLADASELDTLPGRVTLAILLVQDVFAIVALAIQPSVGDGFPIWVMIGSATRALLLVVGALLVSRWILPALFHWVAELPELLLLSAISWCFIVCLVAVKLGLSQAMGALIAGLSISALPYSLDVIAKIRSLRDFFITLFFVSLGMLLVWPGGSLLVQAVALSVVVLLSRALLIWPMLRLAGFDNRTGALSSIHLAQISEFSLVIVLLGVNLGHIQNDIVSLVVIVLVITSTASTYLMHFSHAIAGFLVRGIAGTSYKDRHAPRHDQDPPQPAEIMLIGCHRIGESLIPALLASGADFSVVDFNPQLHESLKQRGVRCVYGDISHLDTLEHAGVEHAQVLICSIPDDFLRGIDNRRLLESLKRLNPAARIVVTAESENEAMALYDRGADHVILPRILAAESLASVIDVLRIGSIEKHRREQIDRLRLRTSAEPV